MREEAISANAVSEATNGAEMREIFSGKLSSAAALEKLRERLLDLSGRNRLINFKHAKGKSRKSLQFAGLPNLNKLYQHLLEEKPVLLKPVPEPDEVPRDGEDLSEEKPDAKDYAKSLGIPTSYDLLPEKDGAFLDELGRQIHLQTLLYPDDLESTAKKIGLAARTAIEETGSNMLYLVFGFLEYFDSKDSNESMLAPLLVVPVKVERGQVNPNTSMYDYHISYSGEDINENLTLRQKLNQLRLTLPQLEDDDTPEIYFDRMANAFQNQARWRIRRQLTLCMLSFGKLAMWRDLDPNQPNLLTHPLLGALFDGTGTGNSSEKFVDEYDIDAHPQQVNLIYDADASQHTAIIDALSGKSMVIHGPPGTGKSQTITNIIAAAMHSGKKVLFISEKLAALEVVRDRLDRAKLADFCLELHSHKSQKRELLDNLNERIEAKYRSQPDLRAKTAQLADKRTQLNEYVELMRLKGTNQIDLTIQEIFWASERRRQKIGAEDQYLLSISLKDAANWDYKELHERLSVLAQISRIFALAQYGRNNPWMGFDPTPLGPGIDEEVSQILEAALDKAKKLNDIWNNLENLGVGESQITKLEEYSQRIMALPNPSPKIQQAIFLKIFGKNDPKGKNSMAAITAAVDLLTRVRGWRAIERETLKNSPTEQDLEEINQISKELQKKSSAFKDHVCFTSLGKLRANLAALKSEVRCLSDLVSSINRKSPIPSKSSCLELLETLKLASPSILALSIKEIRSREKVIQTMYEDLCDALAKTDALAKRWEFDFDGTTESVLALGNGPAFEDLQITADSARNLETQVEVYAKSNFSKLSIDDAETKAVSLRRLLSDLEQTHSSIARHAQETDQPFDGSQNQILELIVLSRVASKAPMELLGYRRPALGEPGTGLTIEKAASDCQKAKELRAQVSSSFNLDLIPIYEELRSAVGTLNTKGNIFAFLNSDWRKAKKLFDKLTQPHLKITPDEMARERISLLKWKEHLDALLTNEKYLAAFGGLFQGEETDFEQIRALTSWIKEGYEAFAVAGNLVERVNLVSLPPQRVLQLGARLKDLEAANQKLQSLKCLVLEHFDEDDQIRIADQDSWPKILGFLKERLQLVESFIGFFKPIAKSHLNPQQILSKLKVKLSLEERRDEIVKLMRGEELILAACGHDFENFYPVSPNKWQDRLENIREILEWIRKLTLLLEPISDILPLNEIKELLTAKTSSDEALKNALGLVSHEQGWSWDDYINSANETTSQLERLMELLSRFAESDKSVSAVLRAMKSAIDADEALAKFEDDKELMGFIGHLWEGENTYTDSWIESWEWVNRINNVGLSEKITGNLLSLNLLENHKLYQVLFQDFAQTLSSIQDLFHRLAAYGKVDWNLWVEHPLLIPEQTPKLLADRFALAISEKEALQPLAQYLFIRSQCPNLGLDRFIDLIEDGKISPEKITLAFERVFYGSISKSIHLRYPILLTLLGDEMNQLRSQYAALDREIIAHNRRILAHDIAEASLPDEGTQGSRASELSGMKLLRHEISKVKKHIPIRQLMHRSGKAIQELKPCFMMGPLAVSQYLERGSLSFDMVIMDEASQLRPEEALGAISRGKQLIVVGDPHQLPPTNFFNQLGSEDDEEEDVHYFEGAESILDICKGLYNPVRTLRWHYRSQHQSLIAFSNHNFYDGRLIYFPSPFEQREGFGVEWKYIPEGLYKDRTNKPEAIEVVESILQHMESNPDESLGVVTLNRTQTELIQDLLDQKLRSFPVGENFKSNWDKNKEPFFIKNLENVQGDQRDVIFISTTFGKSGDGLKPRQNFGPISRDNGWRRLNVLFTRAKRRLALFTSMQPEDVQVGESTPEGTSVLRSYLEYAKKGVLVDMDVQNREPDSDFEVAVADVIRQMGYDVKPQLGVEGYFIDLVVRNPDHPGEYLAAVECDGATYHSSASARDRDRIRQEILESLGWKGKIWRIWSTDWFYHPNREVGRIKEFLQKLREDSAIRRDVDNKARCKR